MFKKKKRLKRIARSIKEGIREEKKNNKKKSGGE